jgi:hypothetical protein
MEESVNYIMEKIMEKYLIDEKNLFVDNTLFAINERSEIFLALKQQPFYIRRQISTDFESDLFITELNEDFFNCFPYFFNKIFFTLQKIYPNENFAIERAIGICWTKSNKIAIHSDTSYENKITVLYHANYEWDTNWGGENLFYNDIVTDISKAVLYVPGRLVVFDSRIPHSVSTINEKQLRLTISLIIRRVRENNNSC